MTYVGALSNIFLAVIKVSVGILGQFAALIADGIHSLSDLVSVSLSLKWEAERQITIILMVIAVLKLWPLYYEFRLHYLDGQIEV